MAVQFSGVPATTPGTDLASILTLALSERIDASGLVLEVTITGNVNNYAPAGFEVALVYKIDQTGGPRQITGLAGGANKVIKVIHNVSSANLVLRHQNTSSTAANRFDFSEIGVDFNLVPGKAIALAYDNAAQRWKSAAVFTPFPLANDPGPPGSDAGYPWAFDSNTSSSTPAPGTFKLNNSTIGDADAMFIAKQSAASGNPDLSDVLGAWADGDKLVIRILESPEKTAEFRIDGNTTEDTNHYIVPLAFIGGPGGFVAAELASIVQYEGGTEGPAGSDPGFTVNFNTTTTPGNPGSNQLSANNADLSAAGFLYLNKTGAGGDDHTGFWLNLAAATGTIKAVLLLVSLVDKDTMTCNLLDVQDDSGFLILEIEYTSGATSFGAAEALSLQVARTAAAAAAEDVSYDNTESGLEATNVQTAIDETNTRINNLPDAVAMAIVFGS